MMLKTALETTLIIAGLFFFTTSAVGLLRLPDLFTRMHSTGKCDTLGALLTLSGLALHVGMQLAALKILLIIAFIFLSSPTGTHAIARSAIRSGIKIWKKREEK